MGRSIGKCDPSDFKATSWTAFALLPIRRKRALEIPTLAIYIYVKVIKRSSTYFKCL
jgi:hypothetical protein